MLFKKGRTTPSKRSGATPRAADTAELKALRVRARRRLVGALALVLAAFIIIPWVFDDTATPDAPAPIVVPSPPNDLVNPPSVAARPDQGAVQPATPTDESTWSDSSRAPDVDSNADAAPDGRSAPPADGQRESPEPTKPDTPRGDAARAPAAAPSEPEPRPRAEPAPSLSRSSGNAASQPPADDTRSDDGAVALALLEGRSPPASASKAPAEGRGYYLQVAAYSTEADAVARRDKLRDAGVANAYVTRGESAGRVVYRLRVGPFSSHDAAQAAQARLRALGYENGLIAQ